jgi:nucleoside-diphosphate-sugar epimerase
MRVLVTGGAGYVGNQLCRVLLAAGHDVTCLDTFALGYEPIMHLAADPHFRAITGDIRDANLYGVCEHAVVFHLAAISGYSQCEAAPGEAQSVNVEGTRALLGAMVPEQLLVYAGTTSCYGPPTLYARTKLQAETMVMQRPNSFSLRWATLFGVGPGMRHELLPNAFTRQAVQRGHLDLFSPDQRRTFMHVRHAAEGYVLAMGMADALVGRVWDVGDVGLTCTKRELVAHIQDHVCCDYTVMGQPDDDQRDLDVDFSATLERGLSRRTDWGRHLPELVRLYDSCYGEGQ